MFNTTKYLNEECHAQPRLTALLACGDNFMPLSWHMPVSKSPFRYGVAVGDDNKTYDLLHERGDFSLNFLDFSYLEAYDIAGSMHGADKFKATGLHPKKANEIKSTLIQEAYMIYECKVYEVVNFGDHDIFIADVVSIHNKDIKYVEPTLFLGQGFYETTRQNKQRVQRSERC